MKLKRFRRVVRMEVKAGQTDLWLALCESSWKARAVLAMRLLFGKPFGVFGNGQKRKDER